MITFNAKGNFKYLKAILLIGTFLSGEGFAQEKMTENTLKLTTDAPHATVNDVSWLKGNWTNRTGNSTQTGIWDEPVMGIMKGSFKTLKGDELTDSQILSIYEESGRLMLKIQQVRKSADGKEILETNGIFPLVKLTVSKAFFEGMTFEQVNMNRIVIYSAKKTADGNYDEQKVVLFRDGADRCLI